MRTAEQRTHTHPSTEPRLKIVPRLVPNTIRFQNLRVETEFGESTFDSISVVPLIGEKPPVGTKLAELQVLRAEVVRPKQKHLINLDPQICLTLQSPFMLDKTPATHVLVATEIMAINQAPLSYQSHFTQLERIKLQPNSEIRVALPLEPHRSLLPFQVRLTLSHPLRYQDQPVCQTFIVSNC